MIKIDVKNQNNKNLEIDGVEEKFQGKHIRIKNNFLMTPEEI
jgi:hypothetical protein